MNEQTQPHILYSAFLSLNQLEIREIRKYSDGRGFITFDELGKLINDEEFMYYWLRDKIEDKKEYYSFITYQVLVKKFNHDKCIEVLLRCFDDIPIRFHENETFWVHLMNGNNWKILGFFHNKRFFEYFAEKISRTLDEKKIKDICITNSVACDVFNAIKKYYILEETDDNFFKRFDYTHYNIESAEEEVNRLRKESKNKIIICEVVKL